MKVLIAVVNCHSRLLYQQCIRETWLPLVQGADVIFFLGPSDRVAHQDEVFLNCDDSYEGLPSKVQAIVRWALDNGYTHVLKCDDDVVLKPREVLSSGFQNSNFMGCKNDVSSYPVPYGFCYWISEKAMRLVVEAKLPRDNNDEAWVTDVLAKKGILLHHDPRYILHIGRKEDFVRTDARPLRAPKRPRYIPEEFARDSDKFAWCMYINWKGYRGVPDERVVQEMKRVHQHVNCG
jgi:hypothetical protein